MSWSRTRRRLVVFELSGPPNVENCWTATGLRPGLPTTCKLFTTWYQMTPAGGSTPCGRQDSHLDLLQRMSRHPTIANRFAQERAVENEGFDDMPAIARPTHFGTAVFKDELHWPKSPHRQHVHTAAPRQCPLLSSSDSNLGTAAGKYAALAVLHNTRCFRISPGWSQL